MPRQTHTTDWTTSLWRSTSSLQDGDSEQAHLCLNMTGAWYYLQRQCALHTQRSHTLCFELICTWAGQSTLFPTGLFRFEKKMQQDNHNTHQLVNYRPWGMQQCLGIVDPPPSCFFWEGPRSPSPSGYLHEDRWTRAGLFPGLYQNQPSFFFWYKIFIQGEIAPTTSVTQTTVFQGGSNSLLCTNSTVCKQCTEKFEQEIAWKFFDLKRSEMDQTASDANARDLPCYLTKTQQHTFRYQEFLKHCTSTV